jgi:hypothetical protein
MSTKRTSPMVQPCIHLLFAANTRGAAITVDERDGGPSPPVGPMITALAMRRDGAKPIPTRDRERRLEFRWVHRLGSNTVRGRLSCRGIPPAKKTCTDNEIFVSGPPQPVSPTTP